MSKLLSNTTPIERSKGCVFADNFFSSVDVSANGGEVFGTPTFGREGVLLSRTTDAITYSVGSKIRTSKISFVIDFVPDFLSDDELNQCFMDTVGAQRYIIRKYQGTTNYLQVYLGSTTQVAQVSYANYSPYWNEYKRNVILVSAESGGGANKVWLNGNLVSNTVTSWTPQNDFNIVVGGLGNNTGSFDGTIKSFKIFNTLLTEQDAINYYEQDANFKTQQLLKEAVLYHDYRDGSFADKSRHGNDGVSSDCYFTQGGIKNNSGRVVVADDPSLQLTEGTLVVFNKQGFSGESSGAQRLISKRDSGGIDFDWYMTNNTGISITDNALTPDIITSFNGAKYHAVNIKNDEVPEGFKDGASIGLYNAIINLVAGTASLNILNFYTATTLKFKGVLSSVLIFPRQLTSQEHHDLYEYLQTLHFSKSPYNNFKVNLKVVDDSSLVAGYNMRPQGNKIIDVSSQSNDGAINNTTYQQTLLGDALVFNGVDSHVNLGDKSELVPGSAEDFTLSLWAKQTGTISDFNCLYAKSDGGLSSDMGFLVYLRNRDITVSLNDGSVTNETFSTTTDAVWENVFNHIVVAVNKSGGNFVKVYVNGVAVINEAITRLGSWDKAGQDAFIGLLKLGTWPFEGAILAPQIHNETKDLAWVKGEYNRGKQALFACGGIRESVDTQTQQLENSPFKIVSGSFKVNRDKEIECVTAGAISIPTRYFKQTPTEAAYGTWEFSLYNTSLVTSSISIVFCASVEGSASDVSQNGYNLTVNSADSLVLSRRDAGSQTNLFVSTAGYVETDKHLLFKITRSVGGEFSIYIDNVLVPTASGSNPVTDNANTTSNYMVFDIDAGDKIKYNSIVKRVLT